MKKLLQQSLVYTLVFTLVFSAFAGYVVHAESYTEGEICTEIGMLEGDGNGVTDEYLASQATRYQASIMYLRLKGLEDEMLVYDYEGKTNFSDALGEGEYIQRLLAYLKHNPELGWVGIGNNKFDPNSPITNQAYTKVILEALGYKEEVDFEWDDVFDFAESLGMEVYDDKDSMFTIDELCKVTVTGLKMTNKDDQLLVDTLIDLEVIDLDKAVELGLTVKEEEPEEDPLTVDVVSDTKVKLKFSKPIDRINAENIKITNNRAVVVVNNITVSLDKTEAVLGISQVQFNTALEITVSGLKSDNEMLDVMTESVVVPSVDEIYKIQILCDDYDYTIKSDGLSEATLTAQLVQIYDNASVNVNAQVVFSTTKGSIDLPEVTMIAGEASTDIRSVLSTTEVNSYVNVSIAEAPSATYLEGLSGQTKLVFSPTETADAQQSLLKVNSVTATQGDTLSVDFAGNILASDYKTILLEAAGESRWSDIAGTEDATLTIDGQLVPIVDVIQVGAAKLNFILATDSPGSEAPSTTPIRIGYTSSMVNYIADGEQHVLTFPSNVGGLIKADLSGVSFMATDALRPYCLGVVDSTQTTLNIKFSEPMAEDDIEIQRGTASEKIIINTKKVYLTASPEGATSTEIAIANQKKYILVNEMYVGAYDASTGTSTRDTVTIVLDKSSILTSPSNTIIVEPIADWAGMTDINNKSMSYTFNFVVTMDTEIPTVSITRQSAEQYLVEFSEKIYFTDGMEEGIKFFSNNNSDKPFVLDDNEDYKYATEDYIITDISDANGDNTVLLIEMIKDWTEYYNTLTTKQNYYDSKVNPYTLRFVTGKITDMVGNSIEETWLDLPLYNDYTAPSVTNVKDVAMLEEGVDSGKRIRVFVDEPIQILDSQGNPSTVRLTPNEHETVIAKGDAYDQDNVRKAEFIFTKDSDVVYATVLPGSIASDDMSFELSPSRELTQGLWNLQIKYLTDDIGNMMNTTNLSVNIPAEGQLTTDAFVLWAAFDNAEGTTFQDKDFIYIKFSEVMKETEADGVYRKENYTINGQPLPDGTIVRQGIEGITKDWDGVTIEMPHDAHKAYTDSDCSLVLRLSSSFRSADSVLLSTPHELALLDTDTEGSTYVNGDGLGESGVNKFDALYKNLNLKGMFKGNILGDAIILSAKIYDNDTDGSIDKLNLALSSTVQVDGKEQLVIGDKVFINQTVGTTSNLVFMYAADDFGTTSTEGLQVADSEGIVMIANDSLQDLAQPVVISATPEVGTLFITVKFSEQVIHTGGGALTSYDFLYNDINVGGGTGPITNVTSNADGDQYYLQIASPFTGNDRNNDVLIPLAGNITDLKENIVVQRAIVLE